VRLQAIRANARRWPFQFAQRFFRAVEQASFQKIEGQAMLCTLPIGTAQIGPRHQVFVHAYSAVVFTSAAKQVAQSKVQL
jgi:hypothetical protein